MEVHLLNANPVFTPSGDPAKTILGAQTAQIGQTGSKHSYALAGSSRKEKISVDGIEDAVSIATLSMPNGANALNVGDFGSLTCELKGRADGEGTEGSAITKTWDYAVVESITAGPVIEGDPSYSINFACRHIENV